MAEPRTSSGERKVRGYSHEPVRSESHRKKPVGHSPESGRTGHRDGMGRDGLEVKMEDRFARELDWARKHLPDEHPPFVAVTMEAIRCAGRRPTVGEVRERLKALGRDRKSIDERARRYRHEA